MRGDTGTGKTYAAMGLCELYTRTKPYCFFTDCEQMNAKWLENPTDYYNKLNNVEFLVIDDFGTGNLAPGFMKFFFGLMNKRMQWTNKKTVITTNLNDNGLVEVCGDALADRLRTGVKMNFIGKSRR